MMDVQTRPIDLVLSRLDVVRESESPDGWHKCRCPAHEDRIASLGVKDGDKTVIFKCQAKCSTEDVLAAIGLQWKDLYPTDPKSLDWNPFGDEAKEVDVYPYVDEAGKLLFEVVRFELVDTTHPAYPDKTFRPRVPGKGWGLKKHGVKPCLYRLSTVLAAAEAGEPVYLVEGEKDVHAGERLGVVCTTNPQGAGKWHLVDSTPFRGAHVVIVPDNDPAGEKHIQEVAEDLIRIAASVRIVRLPGLKKKGDLHDWVAAGGTRVELEKLASAETPLEAKPNGKHAKKVGGGALLEKTAATPSGHPYRVQGSRMWYVSSNGGSETLKPIADFEVTIVEEITTEEGDRLYQLAGQTADGRPFDLEIPAEQFEDERTLKRMIGAAAGATAAVRAGQTKHLAAAVKLCGDAPQRTTRYARTGWAGDHFLLPGREPEGCSIELPQDLPFEAVGSLDKGLEAFAALLEAHAPEKTTVLAAHMLLAPLARSIAGVKRYGLAVYGRTGSLKTSTAQAFLCLYGGGFLDDDVLIKWGEGATRNAIMALAAHAHDLPLLVDNYKPNTGRGSSDFVALMHNIIEGGDKKRLNRNAELQQHRDVRCWPVFTGEDLPDNDPASLARMLALELSWPAGEANPQLTTAQRLAGDLPAVGAAWVEWLEGHTPKGLGERYAERRAEIAAYLREHYPRMVNILRVAGNLAANALAFEVAVSCPTLAEVLEPHQRAHAAGLAAIADRMGYITAAATEAQRFLDGLKGLLAAERLTLRHRTQPETEGYDRGTHVGWHDAQGYYIILDVAKEKVAELYRSEGGLNNVSNQTLCAQLAEIGAVAAAGSGKTTKAVRTPEGVKRLLHLSIESIEEAEDV